jgi:hypothetical protein
MPADKIPQFIQTGFCSCHFRAERIKHLFGFIVEKLDQDIVFVFKIQIDGTVSHSGLFGNLGNGGLMKSQSGKYFNRRLENLMVFMIFFDLFRGCPHPVSLSIRKNE